MRKGKTDSSFKKVSTRVAVLVIGAVLGVSFLVSGGTFAKWTAAISQMTGANIQIGDWVAVEPPVISTNRDLPAGKVGVKYSHQFEASNSDKATWSTGYTLPPGLSLSRDGLLSGTPSSADTDTLNITVRNSAGHDGQIFILVIHPAAPVFAESQVLPDAFDGTAYRSTALSATGESKVYELTSGTLPRGLNLSSSGIISGTPVGYGLFTFTVTVSNGGGSDSQEFTVNLNSDFPYITTTSLPDATKNVNYYQNITGSGPSPTYAVVSGSLPSGMTLNAATGRISGTSNVHGLSNFTISKTNSMGTVTQDLSIYVRYAAPTITTTTLPTMRKNVAYSRSLEGTGEASTFAISEGRLPAGINLDLVTGVISGVATEIGDFNLKFTRTNESGVATRSLVLTSMLAVPVITTYISIPDTYVGKYYETPIAATGEEIVWSATGLPNGLSIDPATGIISGTAITENSNTYLYVTATNSGGYDREQLSLRVRHAPPVITTTSIPDAEVGKAYSETLSATGNSISRQLSGTLPAGLTFNSTTGVLSGKPTVAGTFNLTFQASNNGGTVTQGITLFVEKDVPTITTDSLTTAMQGVSYNQVLAGTGVESRHTVTAGSLPPGLYMDSGTGRINGTPTANAHGAYIFAITKTNSVGTANQEVTLNVVYQTPTLTGSGSFGGKFNVPLSTTLSGVGNGATYTVIKGVLPEGLTISNTGVLAGTPTVTGDFPFTLQKTNESGTASREYSLKITHEAPYLTTESYNRATIGVPYSMQIKATGVAIVYSISGYIPEGITLDPNTGIISGTPTVAGSGYMSIAVTNTGGTDYVNATFRVDHIPPTITTTSLPVATVGTPYSAKIEAVGEQLTFTQSYLPSGLSLNSTTGVISGTPKSTSSPNVTFTVTNSGGTVNKYIPMTVLTQAPTITLEAFSNGTVGKSYNQSLTGEGSSNTVSITAGALPPGMYMSSTTGTLSGTPTARGAYTFTITKTNVSGTVSKEFTINISYVLPTITTTAGALTYATVGQSYATTISGVGDAASYSISEGTLPPGLSIAPYGTNPYGRITGTPTVPGNYTFTVLKSNLDGEVSRQFSIYVTGVNVASLSNEPSAGLMLLRANREW